MLRALVMTIIGVSAGAAGAYWYLNGARQATQSATADIHARTAAYCAKHQIEETRCPFCNPTLIEERGQCEEHGGPEALCFRCHPELAAAFQAEGDWCAGHGVPESQCEQCNPDLLVKETPAELATPTPPQITTEPSGLDESPRTARPPTVTCKNDRKVVRLASAEIARDIGLEAVPVRREELRQTLTVNAEVVYDATMFARVTARAPGVIAQVHKNVGDAVQRGEVLALVDSSELGNAKSAVLTAATTLRLWERNHARQQGLLRQGVAAEQEALETETTLTESRIELARARQRLQNLGLSAAQIEQVVAGNDTSSLLELTAPFDGLVVERAATIGEVVDIVTPLLAVADTTRLWAMLDLAPADLALVQVGQAVVLTVDGMRGEVFAGQVASIDSQADARTRRIKARAEIQNESGLLRAHSFGRAEVSLRAGEPALLVPKTAVQWDGCCNVVFVQDSETRFRPRKLRLGCDSGDYFEVLAGLSGDELVVAQGSFLLKTEILKGSIGAGCCEVGHLSK